MTIMFGVILAVALNATCPSPELIHGSLEVGAAKTLKPPGAAIPKTSQSCSLLDRDFVPRAASGGRLDGFLTIKPRDGDIIRIDVSPINEAFFGDDENRDTIPHVACDPEAGRVYYADVALGYVVALDATGHELWRVSLPEFLPIEPGRYTTENSGRFAAAVLRASAVSGIVVSEPYVAVRYRTGLQLRAAVYHRAGFLVGTIDPDNALLDAVPGGFRFGTNRTDSMHASCTYDVTVRDDRDLLIEHAVATLLPPLNVKQYSLGCVGETAAIRAALGTRFSGNLATEAAAMRAELSGNAVAALLNAPAVRALTQVMEQTPHWRLAFERALLQAGADVAFARLMTRK